jgi:hypothetical protein
MPLRWHQVALTDIGMVRTDETPMLRCRPLLGTLGILRVCCNAGDRPDSILSASFSRQVCMDVTRVLIALVLFLCRCVLGMRASKKPC